MQLQRRQNLNSGVSFLSCLLLLCLASGGPWRKFFFRYEFYFSHSFSHVYYCLLSEILLFFKQLFGPFFAFLFVGLDPDTFPCMMHFMPYWMWSEKHMVSVSALTCRFVFYYWISFGSVSVDFSARLQGQNYQFVLAILSFIPNLSASVDDMLCCFIKWNNLHIRLDELLFESIQCHFILTLSFFLATLWRCFIQNSIIIFFLSFYTKLVLVNAIHQRGSVRFRFEKSIYPYELRDTSDGHCDFDTISWFRSVERIYR